MTIADVQADLLAAGFDPHGVDGEWGPLTQAAMDARQRAAGNVVPQWLLAAEREFGVHELAGAARNNPRILIYHATTALHATTDEIAWCSSFVNYCVQAAGLRGTNSAAAASWLKWGVGLPSFRYGCVCVFQRAGGHHVAFGLAADSGSIVTLGGNQGDAVRVSVYDRRNLLALRWRF